MPEALGERFPALVHVSVLPFGASGPKAGWDGEEINLLHACGEAYLLPNGLSNELFPDRPPLKVYGQFASYQGGCTAALGALSAWWAVPHAGGQYVDVSVQDAALRSARSPCSGSATVRSSIARRAASVTAACSRRRTATSNC